MTILRKCIPLREPMADSLPSTIRGIAWSLAFSSIGAFTGFVVEEIGQKALRDQPVHIRAPVQFIAGISVLGPLLQFLLPYDAQPPIGDGLLMTFYIYFQPGMMRDVWVMMAPLRKYFASPRNSAADRDNKEQHEIADKVADAKAEERSAVSSLPVIGQPANVSQLSGKRNLGAVTGLAL